MITPPKYNRLTVAHRETKAALLHDNRTWVGRWSGFPLCQYCRDRKATDAHHLVFPKGKIAKTSLKLRIACEHKINLVEVCVHCHTGSRRGIEGARDFLIRTVQFPRYGEAAVREWARAIEERLQTGVAMPMPECAHCQNGYGFPCAYSKACDGAVYLQTLSCDGDCWRPVWDYRDCQSCIESGEKYVGVS